MATYIIESGPLAGKELRAGMLITHKDHGLGLIGFVGDRQAFAKMQGDRPQLEQLIRSEMLRYAGEGQISCKGQSLNRYGFEWNSYTESWVGDASLAGAIPTATLATLKIKSLANAISDANYSH